MATSTTTEYTDAQKPHSPGQVALQTQPLEPKPWVKALMRAMSGATYGTARVDLRRPRFPTTTVTGDNILVCRQTAPSYRSPDPPRKRPRMPWRSKRREREVEEEDRARRRQWEMEQADRGFDVPSSLYTGARLKVMRNLALTGGVWEPSTRTKPPLELGLGLCFEMDVNRFYPQALVRVQSIGVRVKAFPHPQLKFKRFFRLGNTGLGIRAAYNCPLANIHQPWKPPARILLSFVATGNGLNFYPGGVEVDEQDFELGSTASVRYAGGIVFPKQIPVPEGTPPVSWNVRKLGLKTMW